MPRDGLVIEFATSTSAGFEFALREAVRHPTFERLGSEKKAIFRVAFGLDRIEAAMPLVELVKAWRNKAVYVRGERMIWEQVFAFAACYAHRCKAYRPDAYCYGGESSTLKNIWGCINSRMFWNYWEAWFSWGRFVDSQGTWGFDKGRMRHELEQALFPYRFCPALDQDSVADIWGAFPATVNPNIDKHWRYQSDPRLPYQPIDATLGRGHLYATGVGPVDDDPIHEIGERARRVIPVKTG